MQEKIIVDRTHLLCLIFINSLLKSLHLGFEGCLHAETTNDIQTDDSCVSVPPIATYVSDSNFRTSNLVVPCWCQLFGTGANLFSVKINGTGSRLGTGTGPLQWIRALRNLLSSCWSRMFVLAIKVHFLHVPQGYCCLVVQTSFQVGISVLVSVAYCI